MPVQTRRRKAVQAVAGEGEAGIKEQSFSGSSSSQKPPARERDDEADVPTKGTLKVFGDEDEDALRAPIEPSSNVATGSAAASKSEAEEEEEEEEEEESDDEAPEAVSTAKAAEDIKKSARAAQMAAKEQAATQKRKRQQRDELLKKQAEERKKADEAKEGGGAAPVVEPHGEKPEARRGDAAGSGRRRAERPRVPSVLPAEFLTDSSSEDEAEGSTGLAAGPKRRKVSGVEKRLTRLDAGPRDEVVGSTVYRVAKKTDQRLAPKARKYSKASKNSLLKRNRPAAKSGTGFLTRK
ncbi:hypothetical protein Trco_000418 [Trichoderma cornu-damae]|uniref:Uncharacterized protein n=1 Tax=Trichoderma cornu-damae TaxID=654480 RepID=A0A9P8QW38_9HYPO|nr:hypothetical protein Trco_000418 [Trichoderma cornu-damae]